MIELTAIILISILGPIAGSLVGVLKKPSEKFMYNMLAFAAGVMLAISFLQLIPQSLKISTMPTVALGIATGAVIMYLVDKLLPHIHPGLCRQEQGKNLKKTAAFLTAGLFIHNIPEGLAIASGIASSTIAGTAIAFAITLQKVPEGICTSAPYYFITKNRIKSFLVSAAGIIPLVFGIVLGNLIYSSISPEISGFIMAATAGLMIYVASDELIPSSCEQVTSHHTIFAFIAGIVIVLFMI